MELIPLQGCHSAILAFTHLLTGNNLSSSLAMTQTRDPILQEGTATYGWKQYSVSETPFITSSTLMGTLLRCSTLLTALVEKPVPMN